MNLTYANCREHGRTLFGKRPRRKVMTCMICDGPVSVDRALAVHIKKRRRRVKINLTEIEASGTGEGRSSLPQRISNDRGRSHGKRKGPGW